MSQIIANLDRKLSDWRLARASNQEGLAPDLFNQICRIVFTDKTYLTLWDERVLLGLERLFASNPPNEAVYGQAMELIL